MRTTRTLTVLTFAAAAVFTVTGCGPTGQAPPAPVTGTAVPVPVPDSTGAPTLTRPKGDGAEVPYTGVDPQPAPTVTVVPDADKEMARQLRSAFERPDPANDCSFLAGTVAEGAKDFGPQTRAVLRDIADQRGCPQP